MAVPVSSMTYRFSAFDSRGRAHISDTMVGLKLPMGADAAERLSPSLWLIPLGKKWRL